MLVLSVVIIVATLSAEMVILFVGVPANVSEVLVGRVLGTLDSALMLVLGYHYATSAGSDRKTTLMAVQDKAAPPGAGGAG